MKWGLPYMYCCNNQSCCRRRCCSGASNSGDSSILSVLNSGVSGSTNGWPVYVSTPTTLWEGGQDDDNSFGCGCHCGCNCGCSWG